MCVGGRGKCLLLGWDATYHPSVLAKKNDATGGCKLHRRHHGKDCTDPPEKAMGMLTLVLLLSQRRSLATAPLYPQSGESPGRCSLVELGPEHMYSQDFTVHTQSSRPSLRVQHRQLGHCAGLQAGQRACGQLFMLRSLCSCRRPAPPNASTAAARRGPNRPTVPAARTCRMRKTLQQKATMLILRSAWHSTACTA